MDRSRAELLLNAEDPPDATERGVTYEFLERLLRKQKLGSLTTRQVVKQYVVPQTFNSKCSLSGLLRQIHPQSVGKATHYVVHPWDGSFERLVSALGAVDGSHDDEEGNPPYFWIDVFALNQRQQVEGYKREEDAWLHRDEMFSQLRHCMRTIEKVCVIVDPVREPIVLQRAWCTFECAQALQQRREVMLCPVPEPPDCDPFLDVVADFERTVTHYAVKFSTCQTTIPIDKEWLDKEVSSLSPLGEKWLNERVGQEFLGWLADRASGRVMAQNFSSSTEEETMAPEMVAKRLLLMQSLSRLLGSLDRAEIAREILEKALSRAQEEFGPDDDRTLSMRHDLACLCAKAFGELKKSDHALRHILAVRRERYGDEHELVVESMEALGRVLKERRKLTEAISLFRQVLAIREKTLQPNDAQILVTLNLLALTLQKREHYKEAEEVFRRVVSTGIDTLGPTNLDVMVWSNNLAVLYQDTKQFDKAEVLLRTTLRNAEHALGPTHPHTLTLVFNLGYCLWHQGRDRAAEGFFRRELAGCEATKGPTHRDTLRSRQNLARLIANQPGREKEADAILRGERGGSDGDSSSANSSPNDGSEEKPPVQIVRRVAIMNPEVQPADQPIRHGHLLAVAAGLSALPPPRGVEAPRTSSAEWSDSPALPRELMSPPEYRINTVSPTSDGDDRTADDTTAEERSRGTLNEDEDNVGDDVEDEGGTEDEDEALDDDEEAAEQEGEFDDEEDDDGEYIDEDEADENDAEDDYGDEDGEEEHEDDEHRRDTYESGSKEEYSDEEDVVEFQENSINDSTARTGRGRGASYGRQRREQTVTSDDELLVEQFRVSEDEDDHPSGEDVEDVDGVEVNGSTMEKEVEDKKPKDITV